MYSSIPCIYCRTANFRMQEIFTNANSREFAKISCTRILPVCSTGHKLQLRFSIRNHRLKAEDLYFSKIRENFLHTNCLVPKISCRKIFLFYSTISIVLICDTWEVCFIFCKKHSFHLCSTWSSLTTSRLEYYSFKDVNQ